MLRFMFSILCVLHFFIYYVNAECVAPYTSSDATGQIYDYYWRDYVGTIPDDAIPGGKDELGRTTYVGQVYIKDRELLPATIYRGRKIAVASAYNKRLETDKNIKILCGRTLHKYSWVPVKNEETHLLVDCHLVVGGYEVGQKLNFGRVNHNGQVVVGKVFSYPLSNRGLWIPDNDHEANFLSYEILTYGCPSELVLDVDVQVRSNVE